MITEQDVEPAKGDHVFATKFEDGHPGDHFCVGFYAGRMNSDEARHLVVDSYGENFRANGFRKVKKITVEQAGFLIENIKIMANQSLGLWDWLDTNLPSDLYKNDNPDETDNPSEVGE